MCALIEDRTGERWIYESVRRIYDVQSSSEDSLDHRKRHSRDRKAPSIGNTRAIRTASLFIDRLKRDFQRDDDFVPRFRTHCQRNWCPKFTTKYLCEPKEGERSTTSLRRSISKSLVSVTPKVYSIGLYESRKKTRRKIYFDTEDDRERAVEYFKDRAPLARRSLSRNENCSKKWIPDLFSSSSMSIHLISIPTELHLPILNESVVRSNTATTNESIYRSPSRQGLLVDYDKFDRNECERKKKVSDATFISKRFISNVGTLTDQDPDKGLAKDLLLEDISSNGSSMSNRCREFFTPIETTRELRSESEEYYSENGILEDIRKRIDKDFDRSSSRAEEDFSYSDDTSFFDKACSLDHEDLLDPKDDHFLTSIEQSKSLPIIPTHRRSSKSVTSLSVQDDFFDLSSQRVSISKDTLDESYDFNDPSRSSINSTIYQDYAISHDFPFARQDVNPKWDDKILSVRSSLDYPDLGSAASVASVFSISNGLTNKKFEGPTYEDKPIKTGALTLSKRKLETTFSRVGSSRWEKLSEHRLVESIDSGVLTDYSRYDLHACGSTCEEGNANAFYIYERQKLHGDTSYIASDSVCSDDSLDRRVDSAVRKCTEDLVLLERRVKLKLKTFGSRLETSKGNLFALFDWSSGDECIGSISTPSLVSLTDSEAT